MTERTHERDSGGAGTLEHTLAWIFALIALASATLGLLVGFDVVDLNIGDEGAAISVDGVGDAGTSDTITATGRDNFQDALLWMIPAAAAAMLAMALHRTDHHRSRRRTENGVADSTPGGMFNAEHALAYVGALATVAAGVLCVVVGYDVFDNGNTVEDGYLWGIGGFITSIVTVALHSVRHHQLEAEEDVIVRLIEERTSRGMAPRSERATERREEPLR